MIYRIPMMLLAVVFFNAGILAQNEPAITAQNENVLNGPVPLPGGKVIASGNYYVELVFFPNDTSIVYMFDASAVPLSNIGITGIIVFHNYDNTISAFDLVQHKNDEFIVRTNVSSYKRCDINLEVNGGSVSVKFYPN